MTRHQRTLQQTITRELILAAVFLLFGLLLLPLLVYVVGGLVFGPYAGDGVGQFYGGLFAGLGDGDWAAWLLVVAPFLGISFLRILTRAWRHSRVAAS
jgi:hypothetical protein